MPPLIGHELAEEVAHAGEGPIFGGLIHEPGSLYKAIDFLEGYEVRGDLIDDAPDPFQVEDAVGSLAVVGIVDENPEGIGSWCRYPLLGDPRAGR